MNDTPLADFVLAQLPRPPARVLEVGCGEGALARAIADAGYDVVAIDPKAPVGPIFRQMTIGELAEEPFDAAVAVRSLHHVHDLEAALAKIARLAPLLVIEEFAWDRLDDETADWYEGQRRALAAAGAEPEELSRESWVREHEDLHGLERLRRALEANFHTRSFTWEPYLYRYLGGVATEALERTLIDVDAIRALGFRYVGERR